MIRSAFEFANSGDVAGLAIGKNGARSLNFRWRNLQDFGSGIDDQAEQLVFEFHDQNAVFLVRLDLRVAEPFAQIHHGNNLSRAD